MNRTLAIAALLTVSATAAVTAVVVPWNDPAREPRQPCVALHALTDSLELDGVADQALIRVRAARLSDSLERRAERLRAVNGVDARVAVGLRELLSDPNATVAQMVTLLEPVATRCSSA